MLTWQIYFVLQGLTAVIPDSTMPLPLKIDFNAGVFSVLLSSQSLNISVLDLSSASVV